MMKLTRGIATVGVAAFLLAAAGCESFGTNPADNPFQTDCQKSTAISNLSGKRHGEACTTAAECMYGFCKFGALQLINDATKGVCTKDCSCGANSECSKENIAGQSYSCIFGAAKPVAKECAAVCTSDAQCAAINPALPFCLSSSGYSGVFSTALRNCAAQKP